MLRICLSLTFCLLLAAAWSISTPAAARVKGNEKQHKNWMDYVKSRDGKSGDQRPFGTNIQPVQSSQQIRAR